MHKHLQDCLAMATAKVLWLVDIEQAHPFWLNTYYLSDCHKLNSLCFIARNGSATTKLVSH
jgi:hypothetical protein